jgi:hypothetical protein
MKHFLLKITLITTLFVSSFANAGLMKDLDLNNATTGSTIEFKSAVTAIDLFRNFDFLIPVFLKSGTGHFSDLSDVIGYTTYKQGNTQVVGTLYDFSSAVTLLSGWELSLDALTGITVGNITNVTGTAKLSNQDGFAMFDISGTHTAFYDTQRFTNASFEGLLTVSNRIGPIDVPEPTTIAIFSLGLILMLKRSQSSSLI